MADGGDVAALGLVGLLGDLAGFLQGLVGALVRFDFLHQQLGLAVRFLLRHLPALLGQHHPPGAYAGEQQQGSKSLDEAVLQRGDQHRLVRAEGEQFVGVQYAEDQCQ